MLCILMQTFRFSDGWLCWLPLVLAVFSALRLAKFNVDERQTTDFIGVATPTAAIICGSLCYFACKSDAADFLVATPWFLPVLAVVLGLLLVSEIPMFGMKVAPGHKLLDAKRIVFLGFVVVAAVFVAVAGLNWSLAVLLVFVFYLIENLILYILPKK
jgi:CDP-diacylglycerol--serine O-phosphatidyltransferase